MKEVIRVQGAKADRQPLEGAEVLDRSGIVKLSTHTDTRGDLIALESVSQVPFAIRRVFFIRNVPDGAVRARHANVELHEMLVAVCGSVTVELRSPARHRTFHLSDAGDGLYVHPLTWIEISDFEPGSVLLALASLPFDPEEHITDFDRFCRIYERAHQGDVLIHSCP